jgi:hypothetical protein
MRARVCTGRSVLGSERLISRGEVRHRPVFGWWWRSGVCSHVCGLAYPTRPVIVRSHARTGRSGAALTDEPIYHSRILSIHTPGPHFCDVIFVGELNY